MIEVRGLTKRYGGVPAVDALSFDVRPGAVTGFLGCYTTVSSFSLQTLALARDGEGGRAIGYVAISVALSIGAVAVGFALVDLLR